MTGSASRAATHRALVVGSASGIGAAVARHLDALGYIVAAGDVNVAGSTEVVATLDVEGAFSLELDVTSPRSVLAAVESLGRRGWDVLDGLVTVAGIEINAPVDRLTEASWARTIETNLTGHFRCVQACMKLLRAARGAIVVVGSPTGRAVYPGATAYAASKAGLEGLCRAIAIDCAPLVRANCVMPGPTNTAMLRGAASGEELDEVLRREGSSVPLGRVAEPADIAPAVGFLLSDAARYITGASLAVDGGLLARLAIDG